MDIAIEKILPNPEQPRKDFDGQALEELAASIQALGVIQPVVVEETADGRYILHDGERRLRAAKRAGLRAIPAVVTPALNGTARQERLARALVANIQRAELNPIEVARGFKELIGLGLTQVEVAAQMGLSPSQVSNALRLLQLDAEIQELIASGKLSKDLRLVSTMLALGDAKLRVKTARALADKQISLKGCIETFRRVAEERQRSHATSALDGNDAPALQMARRKAGPVARPKWDVFASVGKLPPWPLVETGARKVCERCGLRDQASMQNCRGCGLVEMLAEMIGSAK